MVAVAVVNLGYRAWDRPADIGNCEDVLFKEFLVIWHEIRNGIQIAIVSCPTISLSVTCQAHRRLILPLSFFKIPLNSTPSFRAL